MHLLADEQQQVARTFATSGIDRFAAHAAWRPGPDGVPLLDGALAWLVCRVVQRVDGRRPRHRAGRTAGLGDDDDGAPLLYHNGGALHRPPFSP